MKIHRTLFPIWLVPLVLAAFAAAACSDAETKEGKGPGEIEEPIQPLPPGLPQGGGNSDDVPSCSPGNSFRISWADVEEELNNKVAMLGPVSDVREGPDGSVVLELGDIKDQPDAEPVMVRLNATVLARIPGDPEELYADQALCVVGVPQRVDGEIHLVVNEPTEIRVE